jgi:hypothetical protein
VKANHRQRGLAVFLSGGKVGSRSKKFVSCFIFCVFSILPFVFDRTRVHLFWIPLQCAHQLRLCCSGSTTGGLAATKQILGEGEIGKHHSSLRHNTDQQKFCRKTEDHTFCFRRGTPLTRTLNNRVCAGAANETKGGDRGDNTFLMCFAHISADVCFSSFIFCFDFRVVLYRGTRTCD